MTTITCKNTRELVRAFQDNYEAGMGVIVRDEPRLCCVGWAISGGGDDRHETEVLVPIGQIKGGKMFPYADMISSYEGRWQFARMIRESLSTHNGMAVDLATDLEDCLSREKVNLSDDPYLESPEGRWGDIV